MIFVSALLINRQFYFEMISFLYSENLFYFENCLIAFHFEYDLTKGYHPDRLGFPEKLFAAIGIHIRKIGFPLHFRFATKGASIKSSETIKAEFKLLATHLPNLSTTRVDLFFMYTSLCQRFLIDLVRSCQLLPGKKIITVHDTNRAKDRIGNILRIHLNGCSDILLLGGCICIPFVEPTWEKGKMQSYNDEYGRLHFYTRPNNIAFPNTLAKWVGGEMSKSSRQKLVYEKVVKYGSVLLSHNAQAKGQRMGCLLCKLGTDLCS